MVFKSGSTRRTDRRVKYGGGYRPRTEAPFADCGCFCGGGGGSLSASAFICGNSPVFAL
jgi:hypothetical protein